MLRRGTAGCAGLLLALGCGSDGGRQAGSDDPQTSTTPGFVDAPEVAFRGAPAGAPGAEDEDPNACLFSGLLEIPAAEARELGYDVDVDVPLLETDRSLEVLVSRDAISNTRVHLRGRVDHVWRADFVPRPGVALVDSVPSGCPPAVGYELTVQMYTEDGSVSGVFLARASATPTGEAPSVGFSAESSDLRNFSGTLPVARESSRPFFAAAEVSLYAAADEELVFMFTPHVWYDDSDGVCLEPLCPAASAMANLSTGVATGEQVGTFEQFVSSIRDPEVSTLTELASAMGPYRPNVRLWVVAFSPEASSVQARARINGEDVQSGPLQLVHDPAMLTSDAVGGWIDLGEVDEGGVSGRRSGECRGALQGALGRRGGWLCGGAG